MKNVKTLLVISMVSLFAISSLAQSYTIQPNSSSVKWLAKKVTGEHNGTVALKSGKIVAKGNSFEGEFVLNMEKIAVVDITDAKYNAKLKGHLESEDFFSVKEYPEAKLVITNVAPLKDAKNNYTITGKLTIKGITNTISFPANVNLTENSFEATAKLTIDRIKWDIRYGSGSFFDDLGDKMIYDDIEFDITVSSKNSLQ